MRMSLSIRVVAVILLSILFPSLGYRPSTPLRLQPVQVQTHHATDRLVMDRSTWLRRMTMVALSIAPLILPSPALAALGDVATVLSIREATQTLQKLLDNWEKAVVDCTFADVPRALLETKNKVLLLEKAKVSALFDKSAAVVSCKTSNRVVRDYLGATGKGPVVGLEKHLRKALDFLTDPDNLDIYVQTVEEIQQSLSKASSLSYTAGVADFSAVNNFDEKMTQTVLKQNSNLEQSRLAIEAAVQGLNAILALLPSQ